MEVTQLKIVTEVHRAGSLSKASMRLNKSPSILSRHIAALEKECGGKLFLRTGRGVELTELGEKVLPKIEQIIDAMDALTATGRDPQDTLAGEVRIVVSSAICKSFIQKLFARVRETYPQIHLQISEGFSVNIDMALDNGEIDVGVFLRNGRTVGATDEAICQFDTYLVGLPGDPVLARQQILLSELEGLPLLLPSEPCLARYAIGDLAASRGIQLSIIAEVDSSAWTHALLTSGAGYVIAPVGCGAAVCLGSVGQQIRRGRLGGARILDPELKRTLVVAANGGKKDRVEVVRKASIAVLREIRRDLESQDMRLFGT